MNTDKTLQSKTQRQKVFQAITSIHLHWKRLACYKDSFFALCYPFTMSSDTCRSLEYISTTTKKAVHSNHRLSQFQILPRALIKIFTHQRGWCEAYHLQITIVKSLRLKILWEQFEITQNQQQKQPNKNWRLSRLACSKETTEIQDENFHADGVKPQSLI